MLHHHAIVSKKRENRCCGNSKRIGQTLAAFILVGLAFYPIQVTAQEISGKAQPALSDEDRIKTDQADDLYAQSQSLDAAGKPREAESLLEKALELRFEVLGQEHPDTLNAMNDYAYVLGLNGKAQTSRLIFADVLKLRRKVLGAKHPATLHSQSLFAGFLLSWDLPKSSLTLFADLLEKLREHRGPDHRETLKAMANYALAMEKSGNKTEAVTLYKQVLATQRNVLGDDHLDTMSTHSRYAILLLNLGQNLEAEEQYRKIFIQKRKLLGTNHSDTIRAMTGLAAAMVNLERAFEAEPIWKKAWTLRGEALGAEHPETLRIQHNHAAAIDAQGRYLEAEPLYLTVLKLRQKTLGREHPDTVLTMEQHAGVLRALNRIDAAEARYVEVLSLRRKTLGKSHPFTIRAQQNYAAALFEWNKLFLAGEMFEEAIKLGREKLGFNDSKMIELESSYAVVLRHQGRLEEAEYGAESAYIFANKFLGSAHKTRLLATNNYALLLHENNKIDKAEKLYFESFQGHQQVYGKESARALYSQINYASFLVETGKLEKAETVVLALMNWLEGNLKPSANLQRQIQRVYAQWLQKSGRLEDAEVIYSNLFLEVMDPVGGIKSGNRFVQKQLALLRLSIPEISHLALEPSRASLDSLRSARANVGFHPQELAQVGRDVEKESDFFEIFANAAWEKEVKFPTAKQTEQSDVITLREEAFLALQSSITNPTSDALAIAAAGRAAGSKNRDLGFLARDRQDLLDQWKVTNEEFIASIPATDAKWIIIRSNLQSRMASLETQIEQIDKRLRINSPEYFAILRPEPLSLKSAKELLLPDEAALIVVPTAHGTHSMLISDEGLRWVRSDWNSDKIDAAVKRLLWDVGADVDVDSFDAANWGDEGDGVYPFAFDSAYTLYQQLIAPVANGLKGKRHVFVSASGSLSSLPFGMLVSEMPAGNSGDPNVLRSAKWFADDSALIQIPTLQSLEFLRKYRTSDGKAASLPFLGIGDPVLTGKAEKRGSRRSNQGNAKSIDAKNNGAFKRIFNKTATRGGASIANLSQLRKMARLPGTATELTAIWEGFGKPANSLYLADQATEDFVRTKSLDANIIAFATHGLLAGEIGGAAEPGLVLTPPLQASESNDGYLSASEISALELNADWVILSACNTAAGDGSEGAPGLSGLARSFFYAGARNLLASHWPVRDDVAAILTVRTISIAKDNPKLSRAQAFQQAMREVRNNKGSDSENDTWAHPNAWAPFSLIGDGAN